MSHTETTEAVEKVQHEFLERFGADKIWITPSQDNVETILEIWAFIDTALTTIRNETLEEVEQTASKLSTFFDRDTEKARGARYAIEMLLQALKK